MLDGGIDSEPPILARGVHMCFSGKAKQVTSLVVQFEWNFMLNEYFVDLRVPEML